MTYVCIIEFALPTAPLRAPLLADNLEEAIMEAHTLLDQQRSGHAAHIYRGDERVASVRRPDRTLATKRPPP